MDEPKISLVVRLPPSNQMGCKSRPKFGLNQVTKNNCARVMWGWEVTGSQRPAGRHQRQDIELLAREILLRKDCNQSGHQHHQE
jgi:hypothetical protein